MRVQILYRYKSACGAWVRHWVIANNDAELTEYIRRLVKAQYEVLEITHL